jgi:hypothetical protein
VYRWKRWEHWLLWGGAALLLATSAVLAVLGIGELDKDRRLDRAGVEVPARVVRADVDDSGDSTTTTLLVRYAQRGDARTGTSVEITYDGDFVAEHPGAKGRDVRIEYDPADPSVARLVGDDDELGIEYLVGAGVCFVVGVAAVVWAVFAWRRRDLTPPDPTPPDLTPPDLTQGGRDLEGSAP